MGDKSNKRQNTSVDRICSKKVKTNAHWKKPRYQSLKTIEPGWQGIFATCDMKKEKGAVAELYPIFENCAAKLYPELSGEYGDDHKENEEQDIESAIKKEISDVNAERKKNSRPITSVDLSTQCVTFFRLKSPCVATAMVKELCESLQRPGPGARPLRSRYVHRLTPVDRTGKATLDGLKEIAKEVLGPHFHNGQTGIKFAIRVTSRNHNSLGRDEIIRTVASCVGSDHVVDLKNYDVLILVEVFKKICGMSVVRDFEKLKRFNYGQLLDDVSQESDIIKNEAEEETMDAKKETAAENDVNVGGPKGEETKEGSNDIE